MTEFMYQDAHSALSRAYSPARVKRGKSIFDRTVSNGANFNDMIKQDVWNRQHFDENFTPLARQLCRLKWADEAVDVPYILAQVMPGDMNRDFAMQCLQTWSERNLGVGSCSVGAWSKRISTPTGQLYRRSVKMRTALQSQMNQCYSIVGDYLIENGLSEY